MNTPRISAYFIVLILIYASINTNPVKSQTEVDHRAVINFDKGLGFLNPDSLYGVNIRFRMQNRAGMSTFGNGDLRPHEFEANVRRLRLRFDGFMGQNNFTYYLQLSFSRGDQDWDNTGFPGIVRDAMVFYNFSKKFYVGFGQGKLPGNRQRMISSGSLQFSDRSALNATFNIDRDFGFFAYYNSNLGRLHYNIRSAISTGEGRNINRTDNGLSYAARMELLPLGKFLDDGDFFEGDLLRESSPKISVAIGNAFNHKTTRTIGQRGAFTPEDQDIYSLFADIMGKYNGWAIFIEYASRNIHNQTIFNVNNQNIYSYTGQGINCQLSYIFTSKYEIAGRYTFLQPHDKIRNLENPLEIYSLGFSKYFPGHKNKLQLNLSDNTNLGPDLTGKGRDFWNIMFQIETGI